MSNRPSVLVRLVVGKKRRFAVLGAWLLLAAALGPLAGRFESAQQNEPSSFLPGDADSVRVLDAADTFPSGSVTPAIAVFRDPDGLGVQGMAAVERKREEVASASIDGVTDVSPVARSKDGKAAVVSVAIEAGGDSDLLVSAVDDIREAVQEALPAGVEARVTGPAGYSADATKAFEGINSTLLLVTAGLVFVLLVLIYRSPIFWVLPLFTVLLAEAVVRGLGTLLADAGLVVNGQTGGILLVLVFGAGTDYALLLTARYREELRRRDDKYEAMRIALQQGGPAIVASAGTVVATLLCLSLASVNSTAGLGPVGAMGVAVAAVAMLTLLPALLLVGGRRAFWPFVPHQGSERSSGEGFWGRLGRAIERRHRVAWVATALALAALALGTLTLDQDLTTANAYRGAVESVQGQRLLERSFPAGESAPTIVLVTDPSKTQAALAAARSADGVTRVGPTERTDAAARFTVVLAGDPFGQEGFASIAPLRRDLRAAVGDAALVGGPTAEETDLRSAVARDTKLLIPLVLAVVFGILVVLLRAVTAPVMLIATVVLSFAAALGGSLILFELFADFPGEDPSYPLFAFIFLVALGVDYNIFLMARVREERLALPTREAMLRGLAVTGGVITSAGIVLAGTFSVLAVLPLVALTQIGVTVAFGVLLDTLVVRSVLVPALTFDLGDRVWWPSRLSHSLRRGEAAATERAERGST
ncbi:MMPL family transporter [Gaiella sp.]|uniref:MMPL family transporter n=1 Tax=Gaiella sp. TaxID=2663207 RepID=UPI002B7E18E9|nr:MMPL family transporter [Gaiella sp.]HWO81167.1 MMPL family transporter [Gaiella sp.]